jgi:squalene synthase HpnC
MNQKSRLDKSYAFCRDVSRRHGENFPVVWPGMNREQRRALFAVYAFLRTADDLADLPGASIEIRLRGLMQWEMMLEKSVIHSPEHPVFIALHDTMEKFRLNVSLLRKPLQAFKVDLFKHRYRTHTELLEYCELSANPIGEMVLHLFGYDSHRRWADLLCASNALCTALQLINHWQDLFKDRRLDRLYLPMDDMDQSGYTVEAWHEGQCSSALHDVMAVQFERIHHLLKDSVFLVEITRGSLRWYLRAIGWAARRLLDKLYTFDYSFDHGGPRLSLADRVWIGWHLMRNPA